MNQLSDHDNYDPNRRERLRNYHNSVEMPTEFRGPDTPCGWRNHYIYYLNQLQMPADCIAEVSGVSSSQVYRILRKINETRDFNYYIEPPPPPKAPKRDIIEQHLEQQYQNNYNPTPRELAKSLSIKVSKTHLYRSVRKLGSSSKAVGKQTKPEDGPLRQKC